MKFNTLTDYPQTAEVWTVVSRDDDSGILNYAYDRAITIKFIMRDRTNTILTAATLSVFDKVQNIRDGNNVEINPGRAYVIKSKVPVTNVFGYVEEYSYTAGS